MLILHLYRTVNSPKTTQLAVFEILIYEKNYSGLSTKRKKKVFFIPSVMINDLKIKNNNCKTSIKSSLKRSYLQINDVIDVTHG